MPQYFFNFIQILNFQSTMECEDNEYTVPKCPHIRPSNSSQDFDDITLEDNFSLSEIETDATGTENFQNDFVKEEEEVLQRGKRSFHEICNSSKPCFQYYIQRPQKRPIKKIHR